MQSMAIVSQITILGPALTLQETIPGGELT